MDSTAAGVTRACGMVRFFYIVLVQYSTAERKLDSGCKARMLPRYINAWGSVWALLQQPQRLIDDFIFSWDTLTTFPTYVLLDSVVAHLHQPCASRMNSPT